MPTLARKRYGGGQNFCQPPSMLSEYACVWIAFHRNMAQVTEIGILLPNTQRQHRNLHIQKDVLPYALC